MIAQESCMLKLKLARKCEIDLVKKGMKRKRLIKKYQNPKKSLKDVEDAKIVSSPNTRGNDHISIFNFTKFLKCIKRRRLVQFEEEEDEHIEPNVVYAKENVHLSNDENDEQGVEKSMHLKVKDAFSLHHSRKRVLIEWNGSGQPIGESGGLLGGILGLIASNFNNFSIMYKTWHKVPMQYKDAVFENTIKEVETGRQFSRGEIFSITHKKKDGTFVNEEAQQKNEDLQKEIGEGASENEAYVKVFGKENSSYVRGMGFGVRPSQMIGSLSRSRESMQSTTTSGPSRAEYQNLKLQVQLLQEQVNFLVNHQKGQLPPGFPTEVADFESPTHTRPYSSASHEPQQHRPSNV
ncbi:hypothetical protein Ahy_B02g060690 [Arachis hypogaea]|uniref:Uncharacterized protein n=1 Tax=Arachis hypogaea TaxID=3818 RepID=A0A445AJ90_ARAHY|nr:hypothetical protein Ahy_B02g060690 [Arachis hypogaea]